MAMKVCLRDGNSYVVTDAGSVGAYPNDADFLQILGAAGNQTALVLKEDLDIIILQ